MCVKMYLRGKEGGWKVEGIRVLACDRRSHARRMGNLHDVLPLPCQGAVGREGDGGRELAVRGAVVDAAASRRCNAEAILAPASKRERGGEVVEKEEKEKPFAMSRFRLRFVRASVVKRKENSRHPFQASARRKGKARTSRRRNRSATSLVHHI